MEIGGSQINAIELAAAVRSRGHEVFVISRPGPLVDMVYRLDLPHLQIPDSYRPFSHRLWRHLARIVDELQIDVAHGYEWPPALALYLGAHQMRRVPAVCTIMSMAVAPFLPRSMPIIVGTEDIRRAASAAGYNAVTLLEPPVDTDANVPTFDGSTFRLAHGIEPAKPLVVVVGRLSRDLKLEGLLSACDAIGAMAASGIGVQLAIVGDGDAKDQVAERAKRANAVAGRRAVVLTGSLTDPRPAYAAGDVLLGMGSSALRAMSFGKPLVVQGELGFWRVCSPYSVAQFLNGGWYGLGDLKSPVNDQGLAIGAARLRAELEPLLTDSDVRDRLGMFGRQMVVERFSLVRAANLQEKVYETTLKGATRRHIVEAARSIAGVFAHVARRRIRRRLGKVASEDFNSIAAQTKCNGARGTHAEEKAQPEAPLDAGRSW